LIVKKFGVIQVSTGDLIRLKMKERDSRGEKTDLAKKLAFYVEKGELVPDDLVNPIFLEAISTIECQTKGWILDGYPRNESHYNYMVKHAIVPNVIISIDISDQLSMQRQTGKVLDEKGRIFHLKFLPPPLDTKYEQHDSDKSVKNAETRLAVFHKYLQDFVKWYPDQCVVDGDQKVEDVFQKIRDYIKSKLTK
jgi:adenylate kinase